jgi:hypothetical protein
VQNCSYPKPASNQSGATKGHANLSFKHHADVAVLEPDEADALLDWRGPRFRTGGELTGVKPASVGDWWGTGGELVRNYPRSNRHRFGSSSTAGPRRADGDADVAIRACASPRGGMRRKANLESGQRAATLAVLTDTLSGIDCHPCDPRFRACPARGDPDHLRKLLGRLVAPSQEHQMSYSVQQCLDKARECEWMASQAKDDEAKALFVELVKQWMELARQKEDLERDRGPR